MVSGSPVRGYWERRGCNGLTPTHWTFKNPLWDGTGTEIHLKQHVIRVDQSKLTGIDPLTHHTWVKLCWWVHFLFATGTRQPRVPCHGICHGICLHLIHIYTNMRYKLIKACWWKLIHWPVTCQLSSAGELTSCLRQVPGNPSFHATVSAMVSACTWYTYLKQHVIRACWWELILWPVTRELSSAGEFTSCLRQVPGNPEFHAMVSAMVSACTWYTLKPTCDTNWSKLVDGNWSTDP